MTDTPGCRVRKVGIEPNSNTANLLVWVTVEDPERAVEFGNNLQTLRS